MGRGRMAWWSGQSVVLFWGSRLESPSISTLQIVLLKCAIGLEDRGWFLLKTTRV